MKSRTGLLVAALSIALATTACSGSSSGSAASSDGGTTGPTTSAAAGQSCGVHKVGSTQVRTFCGTGTASSKETTSSGTSSMTLPKASCEFSANYVAVNAGTVVLAFDDAAKKVRSTTQYIGLTVGRVPGDTTSKPASADGTYTDGILAINDKGNAPAVKGQTLSVTLKSNRTAGTFKADLLTGGSVTGSFSCG